ncbi:hypothetical protein ETB97_001488 [Aspergillus alliaceus]|uniref:Uncharacterized protein n=1 Tax=Petromyces alliaceus TaxID=209559 RepID=A0A8H6E6N7_PETAA|nr:hypothetical protein ETB97_001488 [Aspergillus burnettii]
MTTPLLGAGMVWIIPCSNILTLNLTEDMMIMCWNSESIQVRVSRSSLEVMFIQEFRTARLVPDLAQSTP